ncbi:MAG: glutaredoxin family protein [Pseudomonadales bacterium]|nr:glutaredoxin family protein [Pseudomonadales bacterium]
MEISLFTTLGCHLCEEALTLLNQLNENITANSNKKIGKKIGHSTRFTINKIEISDSDQLMAQYGIRIPVVKKNGSQNELNWPFDLEALSKYLAT